MNCVLQEAGEDISADEDISTDEDISADEDISTDEDINGGNGNASFGGDYGATAGMANLNLNGFRAPRKKALIIGVSYKRTTSELNGTIPDARNIKALLLSFGYLERMSGGSSRGQ